MKGLDRPGDGSENAASDRHLDHRRAYFLLGSGLVLIPFGVVAIISEKVAAGIGILVWAGIGVGIGTWRLKRQHPGRTAVLADNDSIRVALILLGFFTAAVVLTYLAFLELGHDNTGGFLVRIMVAAGALYIVALAVWQRVSGRHP